MTSQAQSNPLARPSKAAGEKTLGARGWAVRLLVALGVFFLLWIYRSFDPDAPGALFPGCMWRKFTGLECAGCGFQRGLHAALNGRFIQALHYNSYVPLSAPLWLLWSGVASLRRSSVFFFFLAASVPLYIVARNVSIHFFGFRF